jgi:uncharacterized repeat protein (TIGR01451 family)
VKKIFFGFGAIALSVLPFSGIIPGMPNLAEMGSAIAQNIQKQPQVELNLGAEKQIILQDSQGQQKTGWEKLEGRAVVNKGDVLRYIVTGLNKSDRPVNKLTVNQPIPRGMEYVLGSATIPTGAKATYSIDGGQKFLEKPTVTVTLPSGKTEVRPAPAAAYTHIRLSFADSVAAKSIVKGTYQVKVR